MNYLILKLSLLAHQLMQPRRVLYWACIGLVVLASQGYAQAPGGVSSSLGIWLKSNTGVDNTNGQISKWLDQSKLGNIVGEASSTASDDIKIVNGAINFYPAIRFSGASNKTLKGNAANDWSNTPLTLFVIAQDQGTTTHNSGIFAMGSSGAGIVVNTNNTTNQYALDGNNCNSALTNTNITQYHIVRGVYTNGANTNGGSLWINNLQMGTGTNCANLGDTGFEIGGRTSGNELDRVFKGEIAEVIAYRGGLSNAQIQQVESYLGLKYGLSLDQSTATDYLASDGVTKMWEAAVSLEYKNDISGIGRDDQSGLNQKQARSSATDAIFTFGLNTIAASNANNSNEFDNDRSFFVWAHNNASNHFDDIITTQLPAGVASRIARVWRAEENNNDVGNMQVEIKLVKLDFPEPGNTNYTLLVGNNPNDFSNAQVFTSNRWSVAVGDTIQVIFNDVNISDNQFFTIGNSAVLNAGKIASGQTICTNSTPALLESLVDAKGSNSFDYQWQSSPDNTTWVNIAGATANTYQPPQLTTTIFYRRTATNFRGSEASTSVKITALPLLTPSVNITSDADNNLVKTNQTVTFTATSTNAGDKPLYQWQVNDLKYALQSSNVFVLSEPKNNDVISVTLTSSERCLLNNTVASNEVQLEVVNDLVNLKMPSLFTPNNDGNNDTFYLLVSTQPQSVEFSIINPQNQLVYQTKNVQEATTKGWDGTVKGKPLVNGRYIWYVKYVGDNGVIVTQKGFVVLMR